MSPLNQLKLLAAVVGIVIAGVPMAAFHFWLNDLVEKKGREEVNQVAWRTISLAEWRLGSVIESLDDLARRGVDSCRLEHLNILRQTAFATTPIKELSVVAADGQTLCNDLEIPLGQRKILSSQRISDSSGNFVFEVIGVEARRDHMIRIGRLGVGSRPTLAALVPGDLLLAQVSTTGGPFGAHSVMRLRDGTFVAASGAEAPSEQGADSFVATFASQRFELAVTVSLPRKLVVASLSDLREAGIGVTAALALVILGFAFVVPRRFMRGNPIADIERAIAGGEFVPYYQPIVDIQSGQLRGAEALVRWRKPDGTVVLPGAFISLVESSGLIGDMTKALMRRTCVELGDAYRQRPAVGISFNLAPAQLADEAIVRDIRAIFADGPIQPSQVVLEVTERQPIDNLTETRRVIAALQGLGVRIAIDDVGTGHNGLSYMLKLGADIIKIDKLFIDAIGTDRNSTTIIETLLDLARNLRMDVVAEGVENFEQVVCLRDLGIRSAQGYVFAPPLPGPLFLKLMASIDPLPAADGASPATAALGYMSARNRFEAA